MVHEAVRGAWHRLQARREARKDALYGCRWRLKRLERRALRAAGNTALAVLRKGGYPVSQVQGEAIALFQWEQTPLALREEWYGRVRGFSEEALFRLILLKKEHYGCLWRTTYTRSGDPQVVFGGLAKRCNEGGYPIYGEVASGSVPLIKVSCEPVVSRLQRAASRKYAQLLLAWGDDLVRVEFLELLDRLAAEQAANVK